MKRGYSIHKIAFLSIMLALAIVLGYAESFIPSWVPGVKLGLANLVILILLYTTESQLRSQFFDFCQSARNISYKFSSVLDIHVIYQVDLSLCQRLCQAIMEIR